MLFMREERQATDRLARRQVGGAVEVEVEPVAVGVLSPVDRVRLQTLGGDETLRP